MSITFPFQPSSGSTDPRGPGTMYRDENDDIWVVLADSSVVQVGAGGGSQPNVGNGDDTIDAPALITIQDAFLTGDSTEAVFTPQVKHVTFNFGVGNPGSAALAVGVDAYTPTIGEIILIAWFEIQTAFNGTTPKGDFGQGGTGTLEWNEVADMTQADESPSYGGLAQPQNPAALPSPTANAPYGKVVNSGPIQVWVSANGSRGGSDTGASSGQATLHLVILTVEP